MKNIKTLYFGTIVFTLLFLAEKTFAAGSSQLASASNPGGGVSNPPGPITFDNPITSVSLQCFVSDILKIVVNIGAVVAVFFIIYSGFLFVTAQGNETKVTKARSTFLYTIIGTTILLGAWVLATVIAGTVSGITKQNISVSGCAK